MKIERNNKEDNQDLSEPLGNVNSGTVFRFATDSFDQCVEEKSFFMVVKAPEVKDRIEIVNIFDGLKLVRDKEHRVLKHDATVRIIE